MKTVENGVTTDYALNNVNQYVRVGSLVNSFDLDGNLANRDSSGINMSFNYDPENMLVAVISEDVNYEYSYSALGYRITERKSGNSSQAMTDPVKNLRQSRRLENVNRSKRVNLCTT